MYVTVYNGVDRLSTWLIIKSIIQNLSDCWTQCCVNVTPFNNVKLFKKPSGDQDVKWWSYPLTKEAKPATD